MSGQENGRGDCIMFKSHGKGLTLTLCEQIIGEFGTGQSDLTVVYTGSL